MMWLVVETSFTPELLKSDTWKSTSLEIVFGTPVQVQVLFPPEGVPATPPAVVISVQAPPSYRYSTLKRVIGPNGVHSITCDPPTTMVVGSASGLTSVTVPFTWKPLEMPSTAVWVAGVTAFNLSLPELPVVSVVFVGMFQT